MENTHYLGCNSEGLAVSGYWDSSDTSILCTDGSQGVFLYPVVFEVPTGRVEPENPDIGWSWTGTSWTKPVESAESVETIEELLNKRRQLLHDSDWVFVRHSEEVARGVPTSLTEAALEEWLVYRDSLRSMGDGGVITDVPTAPL